MTLLPADRGAELNGSIISTLIQVSDTNWDSKAK